ncbi:hypothetical protein M3Y97_01146800 [Aphelenchoides bicaudatus]|nr:hypothetical protein M3Y97_01146800 [Aphelenchoides bicaudatus]
MKSLVIIFCFFTFQLSECEILSNYHCGIGPVTKVLSYVASTPCGREKLSNCCYVHDRCYDKNKHDNGYILHSCEFDFENCIKNLYGPTSWMCANYLKFTHSDIARLFGGFYRNVR